MPVSDLDLLEGAIFAACHESVLDDDVGDALIERLRADSQALADVRALDEWAKVGRSWEIKEIIPRIFRCAARSSDLSSGTYRVELFEGATPDEARAKAAAWVREQKR